MKKRMRYFARITILVLVMNTLAGCGNDEYIDAMTYEENIDYADDYGIEVTIEPTEDVVITRDETVEDKVVVEDEEVVEDETVDEAEPVKTEAPKTDTNGSKTNGSTNSGASSGSTNSGTSSGFTTNKPADPAPTPTHTHNWKEHTVTEQVWVPNIVVVDDYEERVVGRTDDEFVCDCGFKTTNRDTIADHIKSNVIAGNDGHGGFFIYEGHNIVEQVKVGSHEEDYGHNETKTYVDYYYCDCGERK